MEWVNIFDVGPCILELWTFDPYAGEMVQITPNMYDEYGVEDLYVSENKEVVLLTKWASDNDDWFWLHDKEIRVVPEFDVGDSAVRVRDVYTSGREAGAQWPPGIQVYLEGAPSEWLNSDEGFPEDLYYPNPQELIVVPGWGYAAVSTSGAG